LRKAVRGAAIFSAAPAEGALAADIRGGGEIVGGPTVVTIASPTRFTLRGTPYRYCGPKVQF
jgi:hypothetical protein